MTVRDKNMENCVYRFCYRVAEEIIHKEGNVAVRVTFRKLSRSRAPGNTVEFGYKSIQESWGRGCPEYVTVARKAGLDRRSAAGWEGVWREVLHEVAHAIQFIADGKSDGHGSKFAKVLWWLTKQYPIERCFMIAGVWAGDSPDGWGTADAPAEPERRKPVEPGTKLDFRVMLREKKQVWSWRLQRDRVTVNVAIGKKYWSVMTVDEQLFLDEYIRTVASHKLLGTGDALWDQRMKHDRLVKSLFRRVRGL